MAFRVGLAVAGIVAATLVILLGAVYPASAWLLLLLGVTLSATSTRAASKPSLPRLAAATAASALVPLLLIAL